MKIIKPVLLGPKLIAVGPLKCFKGGGVGGGGGKLAKAFLDLGFT